MSTPPDGRFGVLVQDEYLPHDWKAKLRGFWFHAGWTFVFKRVVVANNRTIPNFMEYTVSIAGDTFEWESTRSLKLIGKKTEAVETNAS